MTIKTPEHAFMSSSHQIHQLYVSFADGKNFYTKRNIENDEEDLSNYRETFYDPRTNQIYDIRKTDNKSEHDFSELAKLTDPLVHNIPPIPEEVYDNSFTNKLSESIKKIGKLSSHHMEVYKKEVDPVTNEWIDRQVMLPGSLWHAKLVNLLSSVFQNKTIDQDQTNEIIQSLFVDSSQNADPSPDIESEFVFKFADGKDQNLMRKYFEYFRNTISEKLPATLSAVKNFIDRNQLSQSDFTVTQLAELIELLSCIQDFIPDFNYTGELFKTMLTDMLMPPNLTDHGGILFQHHTLIAGWLPMYIPTKVTKEIKGEENKKIVSDIFSRAYEIGKDIKDIDQTESLYIGLTQIVKNFETGETTTQYRLVRYNYDDLKTEDVFVFNDGFIQTFNPENPPAQPFDIFSTEKFLIRDNKDLVDLGIPPQVNNGKSLSIITEAVIVKPRKFWRRKSDWSNKMKPVDGIPMQKRIEERNIVNTRILFPDDSLFDQLLDTNNKQIEPDETDWITDITDLYFQARKLGRNIFNNVAFNGIADLGKKLIESPISYVDLLGILACEKVADPSISDPERYREHILEKIYPQGSSLAIVARNSRVFKGIFAGVNLPFGGGTILRGINNRVEIPQASDVRPISSGEYVVVKNIVFLNDMPFAQVQAESRSNSQEIYLIPLQDLLLDQADTNLQKAALIATLIASFLVPLKVIYANPVAAEIAGQMAKAIFSLFGKSVSLLLKL